MLFPNYLSLCLFGILFCLPASTDAREAIVGGDQASLDEFPYQASLQIHGEAYYNCGGCIISVEHILSAAHCVVRNDGTFVRHRLYVLVGTNDLRNQHQPPATRIEVTKIFVPTDYEATSQDTTGDIAVLKLHEPLASHRHHESLKSLKLPKNQYDIYAGEVARISGFGWDWIHRNGSFFHGGNAYSQLRFIEADILARGEQGCPENNVNDKQICARAKQRDFFGYYGVCYGDSGGPLVYNQTRIIGILSISPHSCSERKFAAVYTRVSHYLTFIHNAMRNKVNKNIRTYEFHLMRTTEFVQTFDVRRH